MVISVPFGSILLILIVWGVSPCSALSPGCLTRKRRYSEMWEVLNGIQEKYLFPEILKCPYTEEERQYYDIMQVVSKSMLEKVEQVQREKREYREYIEQWVHELKVPLTAVRLICENHKEEMSRKILTEFEKDEQWCRDGTLLRAHGRSGEGLPDP